MEFHYRMTQQKSYIGEALGVLEAKDLLTVTDSPILALLTKNTFLERTAIMQGIRRDL